VFLHDKLHGMSDTPPTARREEISYRLAQGSSVTASALAKEFEVSEDAIRRDLRALADEGRCRRVYGGAVPALPGSTPMAMRKDEALVRKHALALSAIHIIKPGELIFLDNGSTNLALARALPRDREFRVATNSIDIAAALMARADVELIMLGGSVSSQLGGCIDASAIAALSELNVDRAFVGVCAVSPSIEISAYERADAAFKRALVKASRASMALVLNEKFESQASHRIASGKDFDVLIVENDVPNLYLKQMKKAGTSFHRAAASVPNQ
jgi:DeoR/GlpR family transcriptional regulator of sugar metabolism